MENKVITLKRIKEVLKGIYNNEKYELFKNDADAFVSDECARYGLDEGDMDDSDFDFLAMDVNDITDSLKKLKCGVMLNRRNLFLSCYFVQYFLAGIYNLKHSSRKKENLSSDYYKKNASYLMSGSTHKTSALNQFKQKFIEYQSIQIKDDVFISNTLLYVNILYILDSYVLKTIGLITENSSEELYEVLLESFREIELLQEVREISDQKDGVKLLITLILISFGIEKELILKWIYEEGNAFEYDIAPLINRDTTYFSKFLDNNSLFSTNGALELSYRSRDYINKEENNEKTQLNSMELLLLADLNLYKLVNKNDNSHNEFYKLSLAAYNQGNLNLAPYNLGYWHYMKYSETKSFDRLKKAIGYFIISGKNDFGPAINSLGNVSGFLTNENKKEKEDIVDFANALGGRFNCNRVSFNELQVFFYEMAAKKNDINAMYNYLRGLEKRVKNGEEKETKKFTNMLFNLLKFKHPKAINVFCQYLLFYLSERNDELKILFTTFPDLIPYACRDNSVNNLQNNVVYSLKRLENRDYSDMELLELALDELHYTSCYVPKLLYFWSVFTYCALKYYLIEKNTLDQSQYDSHEIHELLISILKPEVLKKEHYTSENNELKNVYTLILNNLIRCGTSTDIYNLYSSELYKDIKESLKRDSVLNAKLQIAISEFEHEKAQKFNKNQDYEKSDYEYIMSAHKEIEKLLDERKELREEVRRLNEEIERLKNHQ